MRTPLPDATHMQKLNDLVMAELVPLRIGSHVFRPVVMKAVLMVLWHYEGQPISTRAIAERAGCHTSTAACVIGALTRDGYVVKLGVSPTECGNEAQCYRLSAARLREHRIRSPLVVCRRGNRSPRSDASKDKWRASMARRKEAA